MKSSSSVSNAEAVVAAVSERKPELWTRLAWLPLLAFVSSLLYLGVRPGGEGPIFVYMTGRLLIGLGALVLFLWGLIVGVMRRPLIQRERVRAFVIVVAVLAASNYPFPYPSSREGKPSPVEFRLPVEEEWVVLWGGEQKESNRLAGFYPDQRWGMHLVREVNGSSFEGEGREAEQHYCYGESVFAPSAGTVVGVLDGIVDGGVLTASSEPFGNHLVIEVADGEYLFLTQLQAGSLVPTEGDRVELGALIARVGSSGFSMVSPMPHLGLHLATSPIPGQGEGIPWSFHGFMSDGAFLVEGLPVGGVARDGRFTGTRVTHVGPHEAN
jgi:hypothetical protein